MGRAMKMTLINGDCLEEMKNIPDGSVDMILCDPPYGTTRNKWDSVIPFDKMWEQLERVVKDNGAIVLFSQQPFSAALIMSNPKLFRYEWIWKKEMGTGFLNAKKMPMKNHENILVFYKKLPTYNPQMREGEPYTCKQGGVGGGYMTPRIKEYETVSSGGRYPLTIIEFNRDVDRVHPSQKPVDLLSYLIKTYTNEGETVLDFTMGSGSTGVACLGTNRDFIGIELDKHYYDVAKERIEKAQEDKESKLF